MLDKIRCFALTSHEKGCVIGTLECHPKNQPAPVAGSSAYGPGCGSEANHPVERVFPPADVRMNSFLNSSPEIIDDNAIDQTLCVSKAVQFSKSEARAKADHMVRARFESA